MKNIDFEKIKPTLSKMYGVFSTQDLNYKSSLVINQIQLSSMFWKISSNSTLLELKRLHVR